MKLLSKKESETIQGRENSEALDRARIIANFVSKKEKELEELKKIWTIEKETAETLFSLQSMDYKNKIDTLKNEVDILESRRKESLKPVEEYIKDWKDKTQELEASKKEFEKIRELFEYDKQKLDERSYDLHNQELQLKQELSIQLKKKEMDRRGHSIRMEISSKREKELEELTNRLVDIQATLTIKEDKLNKERQILLVQENNVSSRFNSIINKELKLKSLEDKLRVARSEYEKRGVII